MKATRFRYLLLIAFITLSFNLSAQRTLKNIYNGSFKQGEHLRFRVHYGFIDAGFLTLDVTNENKVFGNNRNCWHIVGVGSSSGTFDFFFKIRDRYESFIDAEAIVPWFHVRSVREGGFKFYETDNFNHYTGTVTNESGTYQIPEQVQDLVTSYYYTRCAYTPDMKEGELIPVKAFFDNEIANFNVKFIGRTTLDMPNVGKVKCLKFRPQLLKGRAFKDQEGMTIYVSDDKNYIPIRLEAKILVGSIKADLVEYSGLANPATSITK